MAQRMVSATNAAREFGPQDTPTPNDSKLKEGESMQSATATNQEPQVDPQIEEAVKKINELIDSITQSQLKVGTYVLDTFFKGNVEEVCKHNPKKEDSFAKICKHPDLKVNYRTLRSWVHAAGIHRELVEGDLKPDHIGMSHFVELCSLKDKAKRLDLALEAEAGKWSVSDLRKKIMEAKTADADSSNEDDKTLIEGRLTLERAIRMKSSLAADEEKALKFVKDATKLREAFPDNKVVGSLKEIAKRMAEIEQEKRVFNELYKSLQGLVNEETKLVEVPV